MVSYCADLVGLVFKYPDSQDLSPNAPCFVRLQYRRTTKANGDGIVQWIVAYSKLDVLP